MGVQAAGSDYLYQAWHHGEDILTKPPITALSSADSLCSGLPRDRIRALNAVVETGGAFLRIGDEELLVAIPALARGGGIFAEPAGAAAYAGLVTAVRDGLVDAGERIVLVNTGSGFKDIQSVFRAVGLEGMRASLISSKLSPLKSMAVRHV